jgi:hypothetical protein
MIGTLPVYERSPLDYRYALDAAMPHLARSVVPLVRCEVAALVPEVQQRIPNAAQQGPVWTALWVEPLIAGWRDALRDLSGAVIPGGRLVVVASRPLARLLPERQTWADQPLGLTPLGLYRLRLALRQAGFHVTAMYGVHSGTAIFLNLVSDQLACLGRPDLADCLHFAARLRYISAGPVAALATVALLFTRKGRS